jgi:hypothetical protein
MLTESFTALSLRPRSRRGAYFCAIPAMAHFGDLPGTSYERHCWFCRDPLAFCPDPMRM